MNSGTLVCSPKSSPFIIKILLLFLTAAVCTTVNANPLDACTDEYNQPVAHYTLDPSDTSGSVVFDRMGNHNAVIHGSVSTTNGVINDAMVFDGTSAYLETDSISELTNTLTVSAWVYLVTDPAGLSTSVISKFSPGKR